MRNAAPPLKACFGIIFAVLAMGTAGWNVAEESAADLSRLLPQIPRWDFSEDSQTYFPESLFEYINGAAEIYISYDFKQLIVAQYQKEGSEASMGVEIYEMAGSIPAFGIYSAERYPDNVFIEIGQQGYIEDGTLNFLAGPYYVKLLCFDGGEETEEILRRFAGEIVNRTGMEAGWPPALNAFPKEGRVPNTEKFILRNFLGYGFLHDGYMATFRIGDMEYDAFLAEGRDPDDARAMFNGFLEAKGSAEKNEAGTRIQDRYYHNIFLARSGRYFCGVMKIKEGSEKAGEEALKALLENIGRMK